MKNQNQILAITTALLLGATGALAQSMGTTSGSTTSGSSSSGSTSTVTTSSGGGSMGATSGGSMTGTSTGSTTGTSGTMHGKASPHTPNPNSSAVAQAVQTMLQKFDANRDQYMADRKALLDKLEAAKTDTERKAILDQLKADQQAEKDQRTQLGKEIRDELKKLREQRKGGG